MTVTRFVAWNSEADKTAEILASAGYGWEDIAVAMTARGWVVGMGRESIRRAVTRHYNSRIINRSERAR